MGDGGQAARSQDHPHRSSVHPDVGGRRHPRADPSGQRHRLPRRRDQLHPQRGEVLPRLRRRLHQRGDADRSRVRRRQRSRRGLLRLRPRHRDVRHLVLGLRRCGRAVRRRGAQRRGRLGRGRQRTRDGGRAVGVRTWRRPRARRPRRSPVAQGYPARRDAAAPAVRLPDPQAPLRPLHPRAGAGDLWDHPGAADRGVRGRHREQRPRADDLLGLLGRLDAPHRRRAVHPRCRDHPAPTGKHGSAGRRDHGAAGSCEHPGLDRHPDLVQPPARLPADAQGRTARLARRLCRRDRQPNAERILDRRQGLHRLTAEGLVGRRGDRRERLLLPLPPEAHR